MKKKKIFILALMVLICIVGGLITYKNLNTTKKNQVTNAAKTNKSVKKQLTQKEKLEDFEYMYKILKENYPYFEVNKRLNGIDWLANKNEYISRIKTTKDDQGFFTVLGNILTELNNGHTNMLNSKTFSDFMSLYEQNGGNNEAWLNQMNNPKALARYGIKQGNINNLPSSLNDNQNNMIPDNVETKIIKDKEAAYLKINSLNYFNVESDFKIIYPFLQNVKEYKALIVDIRGNGGGTEMYWQNIVKVLINKPMHETLYAAIRGGSFTEQFFKCSTNNNYRDFTPISDIYKEGLKKLPPEVKTDFKYYFKWTTDINPNNPVGFNGKVYILTDRYVFSSAEAFAVFAKATGFATLVGEKTGGDGVGGDPAVCMLPNSGYVFRFTEQMGLCPDGSCDFESKTEPDIKVSAGKTKAVINDASVQAVLQDINK